MLQRAGAHIAAFAMARPFGVLTVLHVPVLSALEVSVRFLKPIVHQEDGAFAPVAAMALPCGVPIVLSFKDHSVPKVNAKYVTSIAHHGDGEFALLSAMVALYGVHVTLVQELDRVVTKVRRPLGHLLKCLVVGDGVKLAVIVAPSFVRKLCQL